MKYYVIELRRVPTLGRTYATIQSSHRLYTSALKARYRYQRQYERNKVKIHKISYVIGWI